MKRSRYIQSLASSVPLLFVFLATAPTAASANVVSVTLNPATITGGSGGTALGTVTISAPAPAGGQVIILTTSNSDLAASTPSIVIPEGATSATFTVGTNALYRPYSGLAFSAIITASDGGSSASATLQVTAQAIPGPFRGGTVSTDANAVAGNMCGGAFGTGDAKERGILYRCEFPTPGDWSVCTFVQECSFGCRTQASPFLNQNDVCATAPNSVAVNPELIEGGRRSNGTVFLDAPATSLTSATVNAGAVGEISPQGGFPIPEGSTTAPFDVDTFEVAVPAFVQVRADLSLNPQERFAQDYLAVVPFAGSGPPSGPLAVFSVDATPMAVVQGNPSIGTVILNGVAPSGGAVVSLSSNNPAATVPATVTVPAGQTAIGFGVTTSAVGAPTQVTITATFGGVSRSTTMTVSPFVAPTTPPALSNLTVNPATVVGGTRSVGRVTLTTSAPDPSNGVVSIALTSNNEAAVVVARKVTVGHGGIIGDFRIRTFPVAVSTLVTLTATFNGVTRSATLTVNPSGSTPPPPLALSAVSVNPTAVVGGSPSTGTATLNRAAPAGGVSVALSTDNTVATVPASVTVPSGQASASFQVSTTAVAASTSAIITGMFDGVSRSATLTVNPAAPPPTPEAPSLLSPAVNATPAQPVTFDWTDVANAASYEIQIDNTSTIAAPFVASATVTPSQATIGGLPAQRLWWRVRARNSAGVFGPFSATRRFTPQASTTSSLSSVSVNPTSVVGGNSSTGTATLTAAAPSGGAVVSLSSSNTAVATVPASVTIAAGTTSAAFTVTTASVTANTSVTITATYNGVSRTTTLTVTPPAQTATLTVTATGRAGERVTSSPAGINVLVGSTGSAPFASGTSITLSVSNGRDAIWSGACSSGGNKTKTCTFTLNANASVTANVQ